KAVRIRQRKHPLRETRFERINLDVVTDESVGPPSKAFRRNGQTHLVGQSGARTSWTHVGPREERKVGARSPLRIGVEEVIRVGGILVDGLLDQAEPEDAGVKVQIFLCVARDGGDVMKTIKLGHECSL